jgi:hypothetical protein
VAEKRCGQSAADVEQVQLVLVGEIAESDGKFLLGDAWEDGEGST